MFSNGDLGWMLTLKNLANLWENVVRYEKNMGNGGKIHYKFYKWRCIAAKSIELMWWVWKQQVMLEYRVTRNLPRVAGISLETVPIHSTSDTF